MNTEPTFNASKPKILFLGNYVIGYAENPEWEGNYKVKYWMDDWQAIIFGSSSSYLDKILAAGFDGVYLDIIEAFEHFE